MCNHDRSSGQNGLRTISELREICQPEDKLINDVLYARIIDRKISIYVTAIFIRFNLSANFTTFLGTLLCLIGGYIIAIAPNPYWALIGVGFLQFCFLLDSVDGEIARYHSAVSVQQKKSLLGPFVDTMSHRITQPVMYFTFCLGALHYFPDNAIWLLTLGFIGGMGVLGLPLSATNEVVLQRIRTTPNVVQNKYFLALLGTMRISLEDRSIQSGIGAKLMPLLGELFIFPGLMNMISFSIVLEALFWSLRVYTFSGYIRLGFILLLFCVYLINFIRTNLREYKRFNNS